MLAFRLRLRLSLLWEMCQDLEVEVLFLYQWIFRCIIIWPWLWCNDLFSILCNILKCLSSLTFSFHIACVFLQHSLKFFLLNFSEWQITYKHLCTPLGFLCSSAKKGAKILVATLCWFQTSWMESTRHDTRVICKCMRTQTCWLSWCWTVEAF